MKIYTKTGDNGMTALYGGTRVAKHDLRIDTYGTVDELNSWLGLLRDQDMDTPSKDNLIAIQEKLFTIGAILATEPRSEEIGQQAKPLFLPELNEADIDGLELEIDRMDAHLAPMTHFILPGGHTTVSYCHIARTVCRRAERLASALYEIAAFDKTVLIYLNRLSDYLFVLARKLSRDFEVKEVKWQPKKED